MGRGVFSAVCEHHSALAAGVEAHNVDPAVILCSTNTSCGLAQRFQFFLELCVFALSDARSTAPRAGTGAAAGTVEITAAAVAYCMMDEGISLNI
jgi:hypothetical protein